MIFFVLLGSTALYALLLLTGCTLTALIGGLASNDTAILWLPLFQVVILSTVGIAGYVYGRALLWGAALLGLPIAFACVALFEFFIAPLLGTSLQDSLLPYGLGSNTSHELGPWLRLREWISLLLVVSTLGLALWGGMSAMNTTHHRHQKPNKQLALVSALIAPGLGFVYLGRLRWALFNALLLIIPLILLFTRSTEDAVAAATVYNDSTLIYAVIMAFSVCGTISAHDRSTTGEVIYQNVGGYCAYASIYILIIMLGASFGSNISDFRTHVVSSNGSLPTLRKQEQIYINESLKIQRGHLVVVKHEQRTKLYRVIGLPTETVDYDNGMLRVNAATATHAVLDSHVVVDANAREEHLLGIRYHVKLPAQQARVERFKLTLRQNEYWLMHDNRNQSDDSRLYGAFLKDNIVGVAANIVYSPYNRSRAGLSLLPQ